MPYPTQFRAFARRAAALAAVFVMGVASVGVASLGGAAAQTAAPLEAYDADTTLASVGDARVTLGDLIRGRRALDPELASLPDQLLFDFLLQRDLSAKVFAAAAERDGLAADPQIASQLQQARISVLALAYLVEGLRPQVEALLQAARERNGGAFDPQTEAGFDQIAAFILSEESLARGLTPSAAGALAIAAEGDDLAAEPAIALRLQDIRTALLSGAYFQQSVASQLTEEALRARYDDSIGEAPTEDEVRARHILVETQEEAEAIKAEIDGGADFAAQAAEKSIGPSASRGGDLGYFVQGQMAEAFGAMAFAIAPGDVSEPVETSYGWHLIKVEDRRPAEKPAFEQVEGQLRRELARELAEAAVEELGPTVGLARADRLPPASAIRQDELVPQ